MSVIAEPHVTQRDELDRFYESVPVQIVRTPSPLTAAASEVNTGGMIALMPTADDANRLALDVDGAEPASELHTTLLFLGEASEWGRENRRLLTDVVAEIVERYTAITTETFSVNIFNPTSDEFDTAVVLGVRGTDLLVAIHETITTNVTDIFDDEVPPQHTPWVPHITLAYSDDSSVVKQAMKKLGAVTFDRVRVVFAGEVTDYPLVGDVEDDDDEPLVAADQFVEAEHPRDTKGKFAKKASSAVKSVLNATDIWDTFKNDGYSDGEVIATGHAHGKPVRLVAKPDEGAIFEEYQTSAGDWKETDYWITEQAFAKADLSGYDTSAPEAPKDLDAVPPAFTTDGGKTKYTDPLGVPGLMVPAADPGKSGDGYVKKADGSKGPWGKYGAAGIMLRHRGEDGVDRYLLVQRGKGLSSNVGKWQLPGGGLDSNETAIQGATREIIEELGFNPDDVAKGRVHGFHEAEVSGVSNWKYTSYAATLPDQLVPDLSGENAQLETGDAKWLTLEEIQALDDNGSLLGPLAGGKWHDQIVDLFPDAGTKPAPNPPMPSLAPEGTVGVAAGDFSQLKKISGPKGSNAGGIYEAPDGSRWYVKQQKSAAHAKNEKLAADLYRAAGIDSPEIHISSDGKQTASRIIPEGSTKLGSADAAALSKVHEGFAVDALLANWDVAGLGYDNIIFDADGKPHRIDVGGSLQYRAQGGSKGSSFGTSVGEWDTLRDSTKNSQAAKIFKGMTPEELSAAVAHVDALTPEKIKAVVGEGPLADKLIKRREDLLKRAAAEGVQLSPSGVTDVTDAVDFNFADENADVIDFPHPADNIVVKPAKQLGPSPEAIALGMSDEEYMAELAKVQVGNYVDENLDTSSPNFPDTPILPSEVWGQIGDPNGSYPAYATVAVGESKSGNPLQIDVIPDAHGKNGHKLVEIETFPNGSKATGRTWYTQDEFEAADLSEYPSLQAGKLLAITKPGVGGVNPYTGEAVYVPVGQLKNADASKLWGELQAGLYAEGETIADYTDSLGNIHRIVAFKSTFSGKRIFREQIQYPGTSTWSTWQAWSDEQEFTEQNLTLFGIGGGVPITPTIPTPTPTPTPIPALKKLTEDDAVLLLHKVKSGDFADGQIIAMGTNKQGKNIRFKVTQGATGKWAIDRELETTPGKWSVSQTYSDVSTLTYDIAHGNTKATLEPGITLDTTPAVPSYPEGSHAAVWQKVTTGQAAPGALLAEYTSASGYVHQLRVSGDGQSIDHWTNNPNTGAVKIIDTYINESVFNATDLSKFGITPGGNPGATPAVPVVHPAGSHLALWQKLSSGQFTNQEVVGEYKDPQGLTHQLKAMGSGGFVHVRKSSTVHGHDTIIATWHDPDTFAAADLSKFTVPGTAKKAKSLPTVPKLTNAIIYGKYGEGDVIATKFNPPADATPQRLVYKNNKIVHEVQDPSTGKWLQHATYGKAEAYKKIGGTGPWMLGDAEAAKANPGIQLVTSAPTPLKPKVPPTPTTPTPTVKPLNYVQKSQIKGYFKNKGVKWHTASGTMLEAAVAFQQKNPDLTLGQILAVMDDTTKTQTSPTPFSDKIKKYLGTSVGHQHAKYGLKLPTDQMVSVGTTNATAKVGTSTPGATTPSLPTGTGPAANLYATHEFSDAGSHTIQAPPGGYKIHSNSEMSAIQSQMHKQYGSWTSAQSGSLKKYTGSYYATMNECLRKPHTCSSSVKTDIENAAAGMRPLTTSIRVTRGTGWGAIPGLSTKYKMTDAERLQKLQAATGRLLTEPGFMSSSSAAIPAFGGALRFIIDIPEGTPAAWVHQISHYKVENELLLAPGLKYRIKKVEPGGGSYGNPHKVYLEVVYP